MITKVMLTSVIMVSEEGPRSILSWRSRSKRGVWWRWPWMCCCRTQWRPQMTKWHNLGWKRPSQWILTDSSSQRRCWTPIIYKFIGTFNWRLWKLWEWLCGDLFVKNSERIHIFNVHIWKAYISSGPIQFDIVNVLNFFLYALNIFNPKHAGCVFSMFAVCPSGRLKKWPG